MKPSRILSFTLTFCLLLAACADLTPTPTPEVDSTATASPSDELTPLDLEVGYGAKGTWFELYFTDPTNPLSQQGTGGVDGPLVQSIDNAKLSIDVGHGEGFRNPCLTGPMPKWLADHELVRTAWEGIRPAEVWDCHVHLAGTGDSGSGAWINPDMRTLERPFEFAHTAFFMDGACILLGASEVDEPYGRRLVQLIDAFPAGVRLLLMAFEAAYAESGQMLLSRTAFFVPNEYVRGFARRFPERFEWIASVHPYRSDAIEALEEAALWGARAIKWLPSLMNIDPDSPRCDAFYEALRRVDLPLLTHGGYEHHGAMGADFVNHYKGHVKMGDTPSLAYLMFGNPLNPEGES